jgi:hypothetical protein
MALAMETTPHYTQNTRYFQLLREEWLAHYKRVRLDPSQYRVGNRAQEGTDALCEAVHLGAELLTTDPLRGAVHLGAELLTEGLSYSMSGRSSRPFTMAETPGANALRALAEAGHPDLWGADLTRPDSYEEELVVMADVRAYYHIAYKVSCTHQLHFKASYPPCSVSSTIFLSRLSMDSIMP